MDEGVGVETGRLRYASFLAGLILCACLLAARMIYLFAADSQKFPIDTVKISATYQHVTRQQIETVLSAYMTDSFIMVPVSRLKADLTSFDWTDNVQVERVWPGTLKIVLVEKQPIAVWNESLMTSEGQLFNIGKEYAETTLPRLSGPKQQQADILQIYQKLSKLLSTYGLHAAALQLRENQAWELSLTNGVQLRLGKRDLEKRLMRFVKAYPLIFADKPDELASVDLRYARGMAVQWKQQTGR